MKYVAIGLATLAFAGLVWWLARPATERRPTPRPDDAWIAEPDATRVTKVPPESVPTTRTPKAVPDAEPTLTVALLAVEGPSSQAATVPGVELVVGTGNAPASPIGTIDDAVRLATVVADENGTAAVELPRSALESGEVVWAMVTTPGYQEIPAWKPQPTTPHVLLQVVARRGGTVRGVVKATDGERVAGARVTLFADHPQEAGEVVAIDEVGSGKDGAFALHFFHAGTHHVQAAARGEGSGSLRNLVLEGPDLPQDLVVVLSGAGVLAGVVRDPSGAPLQAYLLYVVPAELDRLPGPRDRHANEWSGGLFADALQTDEEGRFRSAGLKPGAYLFMGSTKPAHRPVALHDVPFVTDDLDVELVVRGHRVELVVFDASGARIVPAPDVLHRPQLPLGEPRVFLQESDAEGRPLEPRAFVTAIPERGADGTVVFTVLPDRHYLVGAVDENRFASAVVFVPASRFLVRQELRLPPGREPSELLVRVFRPGGEPLQGANQVYVHAADSGRLVVRSGVSHMAPEWKTRVPAGRYVVRAEAEPMRTHLPTSAVAEHAPDEEIVELRPGQTTEVELRLRGSGRLELTLDVPAAGPDPSFWEQERIRAHWNLGEDFPAVFQDALDGREVQLVPAAGGPPLRIRFKVPLPPESPLPWLEARWIYPQCTALSVTPIAPREYRLLVEGLVERTITIRDGETTQVTVR